MRVKMVVYSVITPYKTVYEDLSHTDWKYLKNKEKERKKKYKELL